MESATEKKPPVNSGKGEKARQELTAVLGNHAAGKPHPEQDQTEGGWPGQNLRVDRLRYMATYIPDK